jgi:hypothetical protein
MEPEASEFADDSLQQLRHVAPRKEQETAKTGQKSALIAGKTPDLDRVRLRTAFQPSRIATPGLIG